MQKVLLKDLSEFAGNVLSIIWLRGDKATATVVALKGDLGAGKTTFVQTLARRLGISETIQSPTYVLMKSYALHGPLTTFGAPRRFNCLVHIDAYRLKNAKEFAALKPDAFLNDPKALVLIEWPQNVAGALPTPDVTVSFSSEGAEAQERFIEVK